MMREEREAALTVFVCVVYLETNLTVVADV